MAGMCMREPQSGALQSYPGIQVLQEMILQYPAVHFTPSNKSRTVEVEQRLQTGAEREEVAIV
jgi:hypothetical protein